MQCRFFGFDRWHKANLEADPTNALISITHCEVEVLLRIEVFSYGSNSYIKALRFNTIDTSDYLDFFGIETVGEHFFDQLFTKIRKHNPDILLFSNIVFGSRFHRLLNEYLSKHYGTYDFAGISAFGIKLGSHFNDYIKSLGKQSARNLIRIRKKIVVLEPKFSIKTMDDSDLTWLIKHQAIRAKSMSYDSFVDTKISKVLRNMIPNINLKFAGVKCNGKLLSAMVILDDGMCFGVYLQAFDIDFSKYYPSLYLLTELIDYSSKVGYTYLDLLRGNETYKLHFCNNVTDLVKVSAIINKSLNLLSVKDFINNLIE
jgi:Acetyltransferase (GNAT) domain